MSKKSQTTGLPKRRKRSSGTDEVGEKSQKIYRTRAEQEERIQRMIIWASGIIIAILVIVVIASFAFEQIVVPGRVVAIVNGQNVTVSDFQKRVRLERSQLITQVNNLVGQLQSSGIDVNQFLGQEPYRTWVNEINFPDQLGRRVLDDIVDDLLIAQQAEEMDIIISEDAVQEEINDFFGYDPTAIALIGVEPTATESPTETPVPFVSPTPSPVPTSTPIPEVEETVEAEVTDEPTPLPPPVHPTLSAEEQIENFNLGVENFRDAMRTNANVGDDDIDALFERTALRAALRDVVTDSSETVLYVNVRHILVETEAEAIEIIDSLNAGEPFSDLARAVSIDTGSGARGGELGWAPINQYVPEFAEAVQNAAIGEIAGPAQSQFGFHIIQVRASEEREAEELEVESRKDQEFESWLEDLRNNENTQIEIFDIWLDYVPTN